MTKVKTILAEFCSPKDILAINRLGLLKKEERETQPIPWRHRLPIRERRELVKSEMRMSLRPHRSHLKSRDIVKAVESAGNPKDSRMGTCLYNIHIRGDPTLNSNITKLQRERSRLETSQRHSQQQFVSRSHILNNDPLLLVERSPSPVVKTRATLMKQHGVDPQDLLMPSYMRPLETKTRMPSTLTTIDAFAAETRKKRNVWEQAMDDHEPPKFKSLARPCARLSTSEMQQLKLGHALHKPPQPDSKSSTTKSTTSRSTSATKSPNDRHKTVNRNDSVFITQAFASSKTSPTTDECRTKTTAPKTETQTGRIRKQGITAVTKKEHEDPCHKSDTKTVRFSVRPIRSSSARLTGNGKSDGKGEQQRKSPESVPRSSDLMTKPRPKTVEPRTSYTSSDQYTDTRNKSLQTGGQSSIDTTKPRRYPTQTHYPKKDEKHKNMTFLNSLLKNSN